MPLRVSHALCRSPGLGKCVETKNSPRHWELGTTINNRCGEQWSMQPSTAMNSAFLSRSRRPTSHCLLRYDLQEVYKFLAESVALGHLFVPPATYSMPNVWKHTGTSFHISHTLLLRWHIGLMIQQASSTLLCSASFASLIWSLYSVDCGHEKFRSRGIN